MPDQNIVLIIVGLAALLIGIIAGKFIFTPKHRKIIEDANNQAKKIVQDAQVTAENLKKEKLLEAKERFVQLKAEHDKETLERNRRQSESENRIKQKEVSLNQKTEQLDRQIRDNESIKENLNRQIDVVNQKRTELEKHQEEHIRRLEKIAALTAEEARAQLIESLKQEALPRHWASNKKLLMRPNKRRTRRQEKSSFKPFSVPRLSRLLKIQLLFLTSKVMKSKARLLVEKEEISGLLKLQPVLT